MTHYLGVLSNRSPEESAHENTLPAPTEPGAADHEDALERTRLEAYFRVFLRPFQRIHGLSDEVMMRLHQGEIHRLAGPPQEGEHG